MAEEKAPTLWQVAKSVLMALLGVQKSVVHERDFKHGKAWQYIVIGLVFVTTFILILVFIVRFALSLAGV